MKQTTEYAFETAIEHHLTIAGGYGRWDVLKKVNKSESRKSWLLFYGR